MNWLSWMMDPPTIPALPCNHLQSLIPSFQSSCCASRIVVPALRVIPVFARLDQNGLHFLTQMICGIRRSLKE